MYQHDPKVLLVLLVIYKDNKGENTRVDSSSNLFTSLENLSIKTRNLQFRSKSFPDVWLQSVFNVHGLFVSKTRKV